MKNLGLMLLIVGMLLIGYGGLSFAKLLFDAGPPQNTAAPAPAQTEPAGNQTEPAGNQTEPTGDATPEGTAEPAPGATGSQTGSTPGAPTPEELAESTSGILAISGVGVALAVLGAVLFVVGFTTGRRDPNEQGAS